MMISVMIVGAGKTGTTLAKELARYAATDKEFGIIGIFDGGKVTRRDTREGFYLPEDISYPRGATTAMILKSVYEKVDLIGYDNLKEQTLPACFFKKFEYYQKKNVIICDCSGGKAKEDILNMVKELKYVCNVWAFFPCEKGLVSLFSEKDGKRDAGIKKVKKETPLWTEDISVKLRTAYAMLEMIIALHQNKKTKDILWSEADALNYRDKGDLQECMDKARIPYKGKSADILCVGAGGTGGNVVKEIIPLLLKNKGLTLTVIDGDRVEEKNLERQAFAHNDLLGFKSMVLVEKIVTSYPELKGRVTAVTNYIDTPDQIPSGNNYPVLIGAVDNHRARQVLVSWFGSQQDGIWIDSANEFDYGEVVISIRANGKLISPLRSDIFPEVLTDSSPSASELSCGVVNKTTPQHQVTNLVAGMTVISVLEDMFTKKNIMGGIFYFGTLKRNEVYAKRLPLYKKGVVQYAGK